MEKINKDFSVPIYIVEELASYLEETAKGRCRCMKFENIKSLLGMAKVERRIDTRTSYISNRRI